MWAPKRRRTTASRSRKKMTRLVATLRGQQAEAVKLDAAIASNLKELGYGE